MSTPTVSKADRLVRDASEAAQLRAYQTHPDVVALRVERIRTQVDRLTWTGIILGLAFTMTNVQHFAARDAAPWSLPWTAAWLLDPMVSLVLIAILRAEQITARYQVHTGVWVRRAKWTTLTATYLMNTWTAWGALDAALILLHSVPPVVVFVAAEAVTDLRDKLTEAVERAFIRASSVVPATPINEAPAVNTPANTEAAPAIANEEATALHAVTAAEAAPRRPARKAPARRRKPQARKLAADFLAEARAAWTPDVTVTPAWVREVTNCSRGLSSKVAAELKAELDTTPHVAPESEAA
ncbi:hypothetical protein GCM10022267_25800 [Lentzea roselyniae]|uniref:DUF2637 domain-containing protein n=1 Tax=Lentzea roselyniae TaxID=531940 RepID=A0ABP7ARD7_9PSEU